MQRLTIWHVAPTALLQKPFKIRKKRPISSATCTCWKAQSCKFWIKSISLNCEQRLLHFQVQVQNLIALTGAKSVCTPQHFNFAPTWKWKFDKFMSKFCRGNFQEPFVYIPPLLQPYSIYIAYGNKREKTGISHYCKKNPFSQKPKNRNAAVFYSLFCNTILLTSFDK